MSAVVALLRGVNVGGDRTKVAMAELREVAAALGFSHATTLLNSGNLVFDTDRPADAALEALLETEARERLNLTTDFMVRDLAALRAVIAANPFAEEAATDPGHLVTFFFKSAPDPAAFAALQAANPGRERLALSGREMFAAYPDGIGESKLNPLIFRTLKVAGTGRNWNTLGKLEAKAASLGQ